MPGKSLRQIARQIATENALTAQRSDVPVSWSEHDCHLCACARFSAPDIEFPEGCERDRAKKNLLQIMLQGAPDNAERARGKRLWIKGGGKRARHARSAKSSRSIQCQRACRPPLRNNDGRKSNVPYLGTNVNELCASPVPPTG
jgi:hypothetical protein